MKLALECPTHLLEMVQPFANFDFALASEILNDEVYATFYKESTKVKIVDNCLNEKGEPVSVEELKTACDMVGAHYVISPDWRGDCKRTTDAYLESVKVFGEEKVIGSLQGGTFQEALSCLDVYKGTIAVPYMIGSKKEDAPWLMGLRRALVVSNIPSNRFVHLFGYTTWEELHWYEDKPNVISIDTGTPILLGLMGLDILDPLESKDLPTFNQMKDKELTQDKWTAICRNIALLRRHLP